MYDDYCRHSLSKDLSYTLLILIFTVYLKKKNYCSATSVDVEEHLYGLAKDMGITFVTSSQVSMNVNYSSTTKKIQNFIMVNL